MNNFTTYFILGRDHIASLGSYDHILFMLALCIRYQFTDWKRILLLVTAFTIGHSLTLALSALNMVNYSSKWIEFLIPCTIVLTAMNDFFVKKFTFRSTFPPIYFLALFFGLIHGLVFSNYLKTILGKGHHIVWELLAFNLGLEVGQLIIVFAILFISLVIVGLIKVSRREYVLFISAGIFALALQMAIERWPGWS